MASSSSSSSRKYEVFLSFRGDDTRDGFTSHLAAALRRKQIEFFIDDVKLKKGDEISPALSNAIETADISIIIFSKDYASSKWCLNELVKILDCKNMNGQTVIPVFYHVDPSDVRKQTGSFEESFVKHERNFKEMPEKVYKWRAALTEAANLSGHDSTKFRNEAELVEKIAADISKNLMEDMSDSTDLDGFVGLKSRIEEIKTMLCLEMLDVRVIGIWGMGGIGKTTLANVVFHQISRKFEGKCFMANVREKTNKTGVINVRDEVICQVLEESLKIGTPVISSEIKKRLQRKKVLIVLDDVHDDFTQLESLAGGLYRFSPGSRIIITTRDKGILDKCGVNNVYEVKGLIHYQALELFCRQAFRQNNRSDDLLKLSEQVVCYANGNPLALQVLGASFHQKSKQQWDDKLLNLKLISEPHIYDVLKISYDELNEREKRIFLDIACFFSGEDIDLVRRVEDDPKSMDTLVDKSLITIDDNICFRRVQMHDLLQEMGREIVHQESVKEPAKRSRLWYHKDVRRVLKQNMGTDEIEGIFLDLSVTKDIYLSFGAFANMPNLRLLKFYMPEHKYVPNMSSKVHVEQGLECLPKELRYLHWHQYPLKSLPFHFKPKNLVELNLPFSNLEQLWEGKKKSLKLKSIDLSDSQYLTRMWDTSETPNLERTILSNCTNLACFPSSIQNFDHLSFLSFDGCESLRSFPNNLHFVCPATIRLSSCENLTKFPNISGKIKSLDLSGTAIEEVPSSIECLTYLEVLNLSCCRRLKRLSTSIYNLKSLQGLHLMLCSNFESFPELPSSITKIPQDIYHLTSLTSLYLCGSNIESLPANIKQLSRLGYLYLSDCNMLKSIPELPLSLGDLDARNCKQLQSLPEIPPSLEELDTTILEMLHNDYRVISSFKFNNCLKLNETANNKILADSQLRIHHMAIASLRRFIEKEFCGGFKVSVIIFPGNEIPEWFNNQSSRSSITIELPQNSYRNFMGFALCAVTDYSVRDGPSEFEITTPDETKYSSVVLAIPSDHVMLGFYPCRVVHTTLLFKIKKRINVKCWGVCPVYANPNETKPNTLTLKFDEEIRILDDKAGTSGASAIVRTSDEEELLEPNPKRICRVLEN